MAASCLVRLFFVDLGVNVHLKVLNISRGFSTRKSWCSHGRGDQVVKRCQYDIAL